MYRGMDMIAGLVGNRVGVGFFPQDIPNTVEKYLGIRPPEYHLLHLKEIVPRGIGIQLIGPQ